MSWLLVTLAGWAAVSAILAALIGRAVHVADRRASSGAAPIGPTDPPDAVAVPTPGAARDPSAERPAAESGASGEPARRRAPDVGTVPPTRRGVEANRPGIVRQRQAH